MTVGVQMVGLALTATVCVGPSAAESPDSVGSLRPVVEDATLEQWGYRTTSVVSLRQRAWQEEQFGKATGRRQAIKATQELPGSPSTFYRFLITEESYASFEAAERRVAGLHDIPSGVNTKRDPHLVLCRAFSSGTTVVVVSTDVLEFDIEELPRIFDLVRGQSERRE